MRQEHVAPTLVPRCRGSTGSWVRSVLTAALRGTKRTLSRPGHSFRRRLRFAIRLLTNVSTALRCTVTRARCFDFNAARSTRIGVIGPAFFVPRVIHGSQTADAAVGSGISGKALSLRSRSECREDDAVALRPLQQRGPIIWSEVIEIACATMRARFRWRSTTSGTGSGRSRSAQAGAATCSAYRTRRRKCHPPVRRCAHASGTDSRRCRGHRGPCRSA